VTVTGYGGGAGGNGSFNDGVRLSGGVITSSGGAVWVEGTGGGGGSGVGNRGVFVSNGGQLGLNIFITPDGHSTPVTVAGTGGMGTGGFNQGVYVLGTAARILSAGGDLNVSGAAGNGPDSIGIQLESSGEIRVTSGTPTVTLAADSFELIGNSSVLASGSTVVIRPKTAGTQIDLGGADGLTGSPLTLGLTDAELDRIFAATLDIGGAASGAIAVTADITRPAATHLQLVSGGDVIIGGGQLDTAGGLLRLDPGNAPAAVRPLQSGTDLSASQVIFGSDLAITI